MKVEKQNKEKNFIWRRLLIVLFWLVVWQIIAFCIGNTILLEGPIGVGKRLIADLQTLDYYKTVAASILRIMGGLLNGVLVAVLLGILSWKIGWAEELFKPLVQFVKAAPITCFVVLLLIWAGSENLAYYIALLVTFPPVYFNFLEGLKQLEPKQLEVSKVYHMPLKNRLDYIYLPGVKPYFISAMTLAVGMAFKAGVAAEIIGTPDFSMGERIYMSKIYLDTAGVLSWMITVIFVAYLCEKMLMKLVKVSFERRPVCRKIHERASKEDMKNIRLADCIVSYPNETVLDCLHGEFGAGEIWAVTGASGRGKTTLLKTLWGLKKPDSGEVSGIQHIRAGVFQENRLFEEFTAIENVFATGSCVYDRETVETAVLELLPKDSITKPVKEYSGGMKRRVEIIRALLSDSDVILMDEPFAGLDDETKEVAIKFIEKYRNGRTLIFATHGKAEIEKMKAKEYKL